MSTWPTYEIELRLLNQRLDELAAGFEERLAAWIERVERELVCPDLEENVDSTSATTPGGTTPSLESFVDQALMVDGGIGNGLPGSGVLDFSFRLMLVEQEHGPLARIEFAPVKFRQVEEQDCVVRFSWHDGMHNRPGDLATIADKLYFALRQLAPPLLDWQFAHGILPPSSETRRYSRDRQRQWLAANGAANSTAPE